MANIGSHHGRVLHRLRKQVRPYGGAPSHEGDIILERIITTDGRVLKHSRWNRPGERWSRYRLVSCGAGPDRIPVILTRYLREGYVEVPGDAT